MIDDGRTAGDATDFSGYSDAAEAFRHRLNIDLTAGEKNGV
jgi:hypothetical protein